MKKGVKMKKLNVLVTGCASGIGGAVANLLSGEGHTVFGIDRARTDSNSFVSFSADITSEEELFGIREKLSAGGVTLDAIVCVAGVHAMVSVVESDFSAIKRVIDVNLLGTILTCRALHGLLKKGGRVIIVTSEVATYSPMPFNGIYNVSKTALECYADTLRQELNLLGQRVITVRPGAVKTPLATDSLTKTEELVRTTELYKNEARHFSSLVKKFSGTPMAPELMAKTVYKALISKRPRLSYSKNRNPGLVLLSLLPKRWQCAVIKLILNRK